jgi:hypothetical protein
MPTRVSLLLALVASVLALGVSPAFGALSGEVNAGRAMAARVDAGTTTCRSFSNTDLEHLGEYVMERMVGSRAAHLAMNARMETIIGSASADRMHQALGRRYAGCTIATSRTGFGMMGGGAMMGGNAISGGWGAMMGSGFTWMRNGTWQHMSRSAWQRAAGYAIGAGMMITGDGGWSTGAVLAAVLGALLLGGLAVFAALHWTRQQPPTPTA